MPCRLAACHTWGSNLALDIVRDVLWEEHKVVSSVLCVMQNSWLAGRGSVPHRAAARSEHACKGAPQPHELLSGWL